jgi:6-pyruvoyltetrahydropterin/6-carboxytetrahydropterin synthase
LPDDGMAIDFRELKRVTEEVIDALDHKDINELDYFKECNPTSENIAKYIYDRIKELKINSNEQSEYK